jgi:polyisoprenoid-binding protein YceI
MTDTTSGALPDLRAGSFTLSPAGSRIGFSTKNLIGIPAAGEFRDYRADIQVAATPADSRIAVTVVMSGVNTNSKMRDRDLQKKKIFNSATWPEMHFSSTGITVARDAVTITGELTVRDQTRRITLVGRYTATTPDGGHRFEVGGVVNPRDFGITHLAIKKPVTIQITAELLPA